MRHSWWVLLVTATTPLHASASADWLTGVTLDVAGGYVMS